MKSKTVPVAILVRVSTDRQVHARQKVELQDVADAKGWTVVEVVEETVSGSMREQDREGLRRIRELVDSGKVRKVLVHEISRLSRRPSVAHRLVEDFSEAGVSLYWHAQRIETLLDDGRRNPAAGIMLAVMAEMARAELETLQQRIRSGIDEARRRGKQIGRPSGSVKKLVEAYPEVLRTLRRGLSIRETAAVCRVSESTVARVARAEKKCNLCVNT